MMMRDNASNSVKACNDLGISYFGCIGHLIHLVIGQFVIEKKKIENVLKECVQIVLMMLMLLKMPA